jgi:hypothetical protein
MLPGWGFHQEWANQPRTTRFSQGSVRIGRKGWKGRGWHVSQDRVMWLFQIQGCPSYGTLEELKERQKEVIIILLRNVGNYLPIDTASYAKRVECSSVRLWQFHVTRSDPDNFKSTHNLLYVVPFSVITGPLSHGLRQSLVLSIETFPSADTPSCRRNS